MCSTPRPKRKVKVASSSAGGTILSGLSAQKRAEFVQRANSADERRFQLQQKKMEEKKRLHLVTSHRLKKTNKKQLKKSSKNWSYWLVDASIKDLFMMLFLGKSY